MIEIDKPSFVTDGQILYTPHPCVQPDTEIHPIGTIWQCGGCYDHWEIQAIGEHPHWVRIRRVRYETTSK